MPDSSNPQVLEPDWMHAGSLVELRKKGRMTVKLKGRQIALFAGAGDDIWACNNRCPHEGYPLVEGSLAEGCVLTCNWHNWKFNLKSGETMVGGDALRRYAVKTNGDDILLDLAEPPAEQVVGEALAGLRESFDDNEYGRMAREIARMQAAGGDPLEALRQTIHWTHEKFEFGATHALPGAADWLALRAEHADDPARALTAVTEAVGHFAWDSRRQPAFPFAEGIDAYDEDALVQAIEDEDEPRAVRLARGALAEGNGYEVVERALVRAALAHYQDFGHALIYVYKTGQLASRLGENALEPLVLMMVRSLVYASREDLIPEFKAYAPALAAWDGSGKDVPAWPDLASSGVAPVLEKMSAGSADPMALFDAAMAAAAWQMAHYDLAYQDHIDKPVSQNVGWLSFTHALTFGNAVRKTCERFPDLWPQGLLQMGCFLGRNSAFIDPEIDADEFRVDDAKAYLAEAKAGLFDHGNPEFIVSVHLVKLLTAVAEEIDDRPDVAWAGAITGAVNRFLNSPLKRKHALRTATQALAFVDRE